MSSGLTRHPDFLKLWAGQTISEFGSLIGQIALLLVAIITLGATPFEVSILRVATNVPALAIGLVAGVWVDRLRRRPLLIWSDLGRALLLASIPVAGALGVLGMGQLYVVALLVGALAIVFEVAYRSYLPSLVEQHELLEGNARLQASSSVVEVAGFGLAGALVQLLTAPLTILIDALSFVASVGSLLLIRRPEPPPHRDEERESTWREVRAGLRLVLGDPTLRALAGERVTGNFFVGGVWASVLVLFIIRELDVEPWVMGVIFGIGGISSLFGSLYVERLVARFGMGRTLIGCVLVYRLTPFFAPLAGGAMAFKVLCLSANQVADAAGTMGMIGETSLVQTSVPNHVLGRVHASIRVLGQAALLGGTLIGGLLGELVGLRTTMWIGAVGGTFSVLWLIFSPLRAAVPPRSNRFRQTDGRANLHSG